MACGERTGNAAPTNGQVDKTNACRDAKGHERLHPPSEFRPGPGLVACALACGGAMARLVIV